MREAQARTPIGAILAVVLSAVCITNDPFFLLALWLGLVLAWNIAQFHLVRRYLTVIDPSTPQRRAAFLKRIPPFYAAIGVAWGLSPLLFFDQLDDLREFACWAMLACVLYGPAHRLALLPALHRAYTNSFFLASLLTMVAITVDDGRPGNTLLWFLPVALLQLWMARRIATDVQSTQAVLYGAQFDLAATNKEALAAVKAKNRFLAAAAHDMRSPVIALGMYAQFLEDDPSNCQTIAPKINRATTAVNALFTSLFDLAALDNGQIPLTIEPVSVADVIRTVHNELEPHATARKLQLRVRMGNAAVRQTDATRLRRMVSNVLSNAIKYSKPGSKILLAVRTQDGWVRIEVWDQGVGIPADQVGQVFQEFYRAKGGAELAPDGMGIGLSLVTRLADALNCRITLSSAHGRGTRVVIEVGDVGPDPTKRKALSVANG
ncbi:MAG: HAMP domain-containing histidine kinase [Proteobacteria bacterium]|nr:HAMP domain-containing histidine kinase [Pseudomonadota bacterium]